MARAASLEQQLLPSPRGTGDGKAAGNMTNIQSLCSLWIDKSSRVDTDRQPRPGAEPERSWSRPGCQRGSQNPPPQNPRGKEQLPGPQIQNRVFPFLASNTGLSHHLADEKSTKISPVLREMMFSSTCEASLGDAGLRNPSFGLKFGDSPQRCVWGDLSANCFSKT